MEAAGERIVPVSLELGGKSPQIVFPDADDPQVVEGVILAHAFYTTGAVPVRQARDFFSMRQFMILF